MSSTLRSVIPQLRRGERLAAEQIDELDRTLDSLRRYGWSGVIAADEAIEALAQSGGFEVDD